MIHCAEIVGWAYEGAAYCGDCKPQVRRVDLSPIFADDEGVYTCDKCGYVILEQYDEFLNGLGSEGIEIK